MKALSIKQPWASLIAHGIKDIENRTWRTKFRGRIYIHASATRFKPELLNQIITKDMYNACFNERTDFNFLHDIKINSAIIGEVEIVDCVINHPSIWAEKSEGVTKKGNSYLILGKKPIYNWVLANPVLYDKPILNVKGKLSFWDIDKNQIIKNAYGRFYNPEIHHYSVSGWTDPNHYSEEEFYDMMQKIEIEFGEFRCRPKILSNIFK
jgi:hypothetical protein